MRQATPTWGGAVPADTFPGICSIPGQGLTRPQHRRPRLSAGSLLSRHHLAPEPEVHNLVTITNSGIAPSGKYTAQLRLSDDLTIDKGDPILRLLHMRSLDPGESISGTMRLKWDPNLIGKHVLLDLDVHDDVTETDEANLFPTGAIQ